MTEINVTSEESFAEAVLNAPTPGKVLALFTSPSWCIPCQRFEPHWLKAQEMAQLEDFTFVKVDMGTDPSLLGEHWATARFSILGVPTLKWFRGDFDSPYDVKARTVVPLIKELNA